ncbi:hypothetical protein SAV31267_024000 [Streptomyces avermitilis]|uniref:Uncharacterized protein n=1 Tax=Streptomyces avermitilis TaxID=33903 RepID=A0A4D4MMU8_STRAX|nr:hypothetical protein SAV31267_024000 [Streptomyces avermitilis]
MNPRRAFASCAAVLTAACALVLVPSGPASAHPLGNFTVNRYDGLVAAPGQLRVDHVEDLAEIPATQAKPEIKKLGMTDWARQRCETAAHDSKVTVGGRQVALSAGTSHARVRPGQAGLNTLRVECRLTAPLPKGDSVTLGFHSAGATSGPGWREITARGDRMTLTASDVPKKSVSQELTSYPSSCCRPRPTPRPRPCGYAPAAPRSSRSSGTHPPPPCSRAAPTAGPGRWTVWWPATI